MAKYKETGCGLMFYVQSDVVGRDGENICVGCCSIGITQKEFKKTIKNLGMEKELREYEDELIEDELAPQQKHEKPKPQKVKGYVYLLECQGMYKIGKTKNITNRLKMYIAENPFPITVVCKNKIEDYEKAEKCLLQNYAHRNIRGEWFKLEEADVFNIRSFIMGV